MKCCGDDVARIRQMITDYDEGLNSLAGLEADIYKIVLDDVLEGIREHGRFELAGSCCCSSHPPDKTMTVRIREHAHGIEIIPINDRFIQTNASICSKCGFIHPSGGCLDS